MIYLLILCIIIIVVNYYYKLFSKEHLEIKEISPRQLTVKMGNNTYDVTNYASKHPGGYEILTKHNGQDISEPMKSIGHSSHAYKILNKYLV